MGCPWVSRGPGSTPCFVMLKLYRNSGGGQYTISPRTCVMLPSQSASSGFRSSTEFDVLGSCEIERWGSEAHFRHDDSLAHLRVLHREGKVRDMSDVNTLVPPLTRDCRPIRPFSNDVPREHVHLSRNASCYPNCASTAPAFDCHTLSAAQRFVDVLDEFLIAHPIEFAALRIGVTTPRWACETPAVFNDERYTRRLL